MARCRPDRAAGGPAGGWPRAVRGRPVAGGQGDRLGDRAGRRPEALRERRHRRRVGAAEAVHRGVRVAERDQGLAAAGHQGEQLDLGRVGVGQLVDVDVRQPAALRREQLGIVGEQAGGGPDQLGRVVRAGAAGGGVAQGQDGDVLPEEPGGGRPVVAAEALAEPGQLDRADAALGGALQQVTQLLGERPGGQRRAQRVGPADRVGVRRRRRPPAAAPG